MSVQKNLITIAVYVDDTLFALKSNNDVIEEKEKTLSLHQTPSNLLLCFPQRKMMDASRNMMQVCISQLLEVYNIFQHWQDRIAITLLWHIFQ